MSKGKVLILSSSNDMTTNKVIDWVVHFGYSFDRFNDQIEVEIERIYLNTTQQYFVAKFNGKKIDSRDYCSYWYRRGALKLVSTLYNELSELDEYHVAVLKHLEIENEYLVKAIFSILEAKRSIGRFKDNFLSKLEVLSKAATIGFDIPQSLITTNHAETQSYFGANRRLITKSIQDAFRLATPKGQLMQYTTELSKEIENYPQFFSPSLLQEKIEKEYELRIFYLNGVSYGAAIFSQSNQRTQVDFRKYDRHKPNRCVPYSIPKDLSDKIHFLMTTLELRSGSLDIIKAKNGRFVFLEVNPIGQFGQVSSPCNYNLERLVAQYLCSSN